MRTKPTRYEQVADRILHLIGNGVLKAGDRIPSIRQLSGELNVSINTVKEAYWRLEDRNIIRAIPQSGYYVRRQSRPGFKPADIKPRAIDPGNLTLCQLYGRYQNQGVCPPSIGLSIALIDPALWPMKKMARFFTDALRGHEREGYTYTMPPGYLPLQEQIARLSIGCGPALSPEDIIITNGCHEAIFLALMVLCRSGDTIVLETPIYFNLLHLIQQLNLRVIEIPTSETGGISLDTLRFVLRNHPVKAMLSISNFNNPMGFSLPSWKKKELTALLREHDVPLIEDDIYGDLTFGKRPDTCKTYDRNDSVLLCSSFSKTIAPGLRVGWIAPGRYKDAVARMKTLTNLATNSLGQIAVAGFLKEGGYERHLRRLRKTLAEQVAAMRAAILQNFPSGTRVTRPNGGFLLWVELPPEVDTAAIYKEAIKQDTLIAPGCLFSIKPAYSNCMRLNAGVWNSDVADAVRFVGSLCEQHLHQNRPARAAAG